MGRDVAFACGSVTFAYRCAAVACRSVIPRVIAHGSALGVMECSSMRTYASPTAGRLAGGSYVVCRVNPSTTPSASTSASQCLLAASAVGNGSAAALSWLFI